MQKYIGTKVVTANPAEKDGEEGYAVVYADGYESWSPKIAFDEAYVPVGNADPDEVLAAVRHKTNLLLEAAQ